MYYVYTTGLFYIPHHWNPVEIATGTLLEGKRREGEFPPTPGKDRGEKIPELELNFSFPRCTIIILLSTRIHKNIVNSTPPSPLLTRGWCRRVPWWGPPPRPSPNGRDDRPVRRRKHLESPLIDQPLVFSNDVDRRFGTHGNEKTMAGIMAMRPTSSSCLCLYHPFLRDTSVRRFDDLAAEGGAGSRSTSCLADRSGVECRKSTGADRPPGGSCRGQLVRGRLPSSHPITI